MYNKSYLRKWTDTEIAWLIANYPNNGKAFCVDHLKRSDGSIRQMASDLRLRSNVKWNEEANWRRGSAFRGKKRPDHSALMRANPPMQGKHHTPETKAKLSDKVRIAIDEGRVRTDNFRGKRHSAATKLKMGDATRRMWADPEHIFNQPAYRQRIGRRMSLVAQRSNPENIYSRAKNGWAVVGGKRCFFRSSWELVYARYLEFLKIKGEIAEWEYEPDVFWFEKIRRGVRSYKPDFKVADALGEIEYHEVKGYMDAKSRTKIKRMAKYHPTVKLLVVGPAEYREIAKWERLYP